MEFEIKEISGQIFTSVRQVDEAIVLEKEDGSRFIFQHIQDCCEHVFIENINGDLKDLENAPIRVVEKECDLPDIYTLSDDGVRSQYSEESFTWTFYTFSTPKGLVDVRWYGSSYGYYAEGVSYGWAKGPGDELTYLDLIERAY